MRIDAAAAHDIEAAFAAAQSRTRAPLACVVAESSADYALAPTLAAAVVALATPWPLLTLSEFAPEHVFLFQLLVFAVALAVLTATPVRVALASRGRRRSACHRAAVVQFSMRGLDRCRERHGVLLYVSLAERYARIVADVGLDADVPHAAWRELIDELAVGLRAGDRKGAIQKAATGMGELLAPAFPATPGLEAPKGKRFHML